METNSEEQKKTAHFVGVQQLVRRYSIWKCESWEVTVTLVAALAGNTPRKGIKKFHRFSGKEFVQCRQSVHVPAFLYGVQHFRHSGSVNTILICTEANLVKCIPDVVKAHSLENDLVIGFAQPCQIGRSDVLALDIMFIRIIHGAVAFAG